MSSEQSSSLELYSTLSASASSLQLPSVPPTPTPTPNPALSVTHDFGPEQLAASINNIKAKKADAGYDDGSSVPATPTPTPFSPSPAQTHEFRPDQVMEDLERLREHQQHRAHPSVPGTEQLPTPAATPRLAAPAPAVAVAEVLAEGIGHLRKSDEGLESDASDPATPVATPAATPISPAPSQMMPEQLAAGINRLRAEAPDGLSSGGSSGFPSTPAPTPFNAKVDGVRPEDLAAGISRLSVIEETENRPSDLSNYFGSADNSAEKSFFDNLSPSNSNPLMHSCRESKLDLPLMAAVQQVATVHNEEKMSENVGESINNEGASSEGGFRFASDKMTLAGYSSHPVASLSATEPLINSIKPNISITTPKPIVNPLPSAPNDESMVIDLDKSADDHVFEEALESEDSFIYNIWIPDNATANILASISSKSDSNFYVDKASLTRPTLMLHDDLVDPVISLVAHFRGESEMQKRVVLNADAVTQDLIGLRHLVRAQCLRAAVNMTGRLLRKHGHQANKEQIQDTKAIVTHSPVTMQLWFARLALLVHLRQFSMAEAESEAFGDLDRPDLYFAFYPEQYPNSSGSMVPFGMRILVAELPQHLGKYAEAIDRLYILRDQVQRVKIHIEKHEFESESLAEYAKQLWRKRELQVIYSLVKCCVSQKDYEMAVLHLRMLLVDAKSSSHMATVYSALARCFLQLGDLMEAQKHFSDASSLRPEDAVESLIDNALMAMALQDYELALKSLYKGEETRPNCPLIINNIAVCLLYMGKLKESISFLETRVGNSPAIFLQENVILNLSTLYELESSYAAQKKSALLDLVSLHCGDGINTSCLKLQT